MSPVPASYALELRSLRKSFGKTEIIRGADLVVVPGERVAIIGPNGAGKSTLFNLISGAIRPSSGSVVFEGRELTGAAPHQMLAAGLARSFASSRSARNFRKVYL